MAAERKFKAMGTEAHVMVVGRNAGVLLDYAQDRIEDLEAKWSRFRPTSELCRLNNTHGVPAVVSHETFEIVSRAVDAWFLTAGRFDPTILPALVAAGYDTSFDRLRPRPAQMPPQPKSPGCAEIRLAEDVNTVILPHDVQLDLGGIGKGYAADLVATELLQRGATGALVSLGGDLRVTGTPPWDEGWLIDIEDPLDPAKNAAQLVLADGAVVTTTKLKRAWTTADTNEPRHHIIDPMTGRPAHTGVSQATVVAGEAWWAEALAKAAFLAGLSDGIRLLAGLGVTGIVFDDHGAPHRVAHLETFTR